jgi:hypothetical protein
MEYKNNGAKDRWAAVTELFKQNNTIKENRGAEIGVREAFFSCYLLNEFANLWMLLVDPYMPYQDVVNFYNQEQQFAWLTEARRRLDKFDKRYTLKIDHSNKACVYQEDGSLDFVFIDAEHTTPAVITDITLWLPKVRKGGIMCGHDYNMPQVRAGVDKMCKDVLYIKTADVWAVEV